MDISSSSMVSSAVAGISSESGDAQVAVLKKALDSQAQAAAGLIDALPQPPSLATTGSLGTRVNTYA